MKTVLNMLFAIDYWTFLTSNKFNMSRMNQSVSS